MTRTPELSLISSHEMPLIWTEHMWQEIFVIEEKNELQQCGKGATVQNKLRLEISWRIFFFNQNYSSINKLKWNKVTLELVLSAQMPPPPRISIVKYPRPLLLKKKKKKKKKISWSPSYNYSSCVYIYTFISCPLYCGCSFKYLRK